MTDKQVIWYLIVLALWIATALYGRCIAKKWMILALEYQKKYDDLLLDRIQQQIADKNNDLHIGKARL